MKLSAIEQRAIQRFCDENNCKPALSVFPNEVNFTKKDTGERITMTLLDLVRHHEIALAEESTMAKQEKKRQEQENARAESRKRFYGSN